MKIGKLAQRKKENSRRPGTLRGEDPPERKIRYLSTAVCPVRGEKKKGRTTGKRKRLLATTRYKKRAAQLKGKTESCHRETSVIARTGRRKVGIYRGKEAQGCTKRPALSSGKREVLQILVAQQISLFDQQKSKEKPPRD